MKRLEIPPESFPEDEMDLINRSMHRTGTRYTLHSKRKYLTEDPEAWLLAIAITCEYYKEKSRFNISSSLEEFTKIYTGDDPATRARDILDLSKRVYQALYFGVETDDEKGTAEDVLTWCERCQRFHMAKPVWKPWLDKDGNPHNWQYDIRCEVKSIPTSKVVKYCLRCSTMHWAIGEIPICPLNGHTESTVFWWCSVCQGLHQEDNDLPTCPVTGTKPVPPPKPEVITFDFPSTTESEEEESPPPNIETFDFPETTDEQTRVEGESR